MSRLAAAIALAAASCTPLHGEFVCATDEQCGPAGRCEANGRCSAPDLSCESGYRYDDSAGATGGTCTDPAGGPGPGPGPGPGGACTVTAIGATDGATCALRDDGAVWCWGDGSSTPARVQLVPAPGAVVELALGAAGRCARFDGGAVTCWAGPKTGDLGVVARPGIAIGAHHLCVVIGEQAHCLGANDHGQLGDNTRTARSTLAPAMLAGVRQVAAGGDSTCAITTTGEVHCWGAGDRGQLGNGFLLDQLTPQRIVGSETYAAVTHGDGFVCARTTAGAVDCWGANERGQLGADSILDSSGFAARTHNLAAIGALDAGGDHTCAIAGTGEARCWGNDATQQCGTAPSSDCPMCVDPPAAPVTDAQGKAIAWAEVVAAGRHSCGRTTAGAIACWGSNAVGQLGRATPAMTATPVAPALPCR